MSIRVGGGGDAQPPRSDDALAVVVGVVMFLFGVLVGVVVAS